MSRAPVTPEPVVVQPSNNIYTVLAGVALVVVLLALVALWLRGGDVFPGGLFGPVK
jgi:hypothetical protein